MRNMQDVNARIRAELDQWFPKQCKNIYEDYYFYYLPTTAEHNGGVLIVKDSPANQEYQLVTRIRKDLTKDQNFLMLSNFCRKLPILEY